MHSAFRLSAGFFVSGIALLLFVLLPSMSRAVPVTVNGTTYDVQFFQGPASFNDNRTTLTDPASVPWWGDSALATDFANAYFNDQGSTPFELTGFIDLLAFGYANDGINTNQIELDETGGVRDFIWPEDFGQPNIHYAYVSGAALPVPEIDGGALGQGAVILLAVWLMLRRRAGAGLRRVAVRPRG